jgi:hypothetical protein
MLSLLRLTRWCFALMTATAMFCPGSTHAQTNDALAPLPPQQNQEWTPPATTLQPVVVEAITELFKDGLPDPRGCEYREIEIAETKTWKFKTNGWVLPGTGIQKYAIAWNGVIYPVASVGAAVDLSKDIAAIPLNQRRFRGYGVGWPMSDQLSARVDVGALPVHVAFLLRLGQGKLAGEMWDAGYGDHDHYPTPSDPYVDMAGVWLDRASNRAVQAFLNHDDANALAISRQLSPVIARVQAAANAGGIADPWPASMYGSHLWQLPILEADLEHRIAEKPYVPVVESGQPASGPERIAALIHDLEQSYATQFMNPGETNIADDPTVQALVKEGYPAVEPLLKCLVEDNRLTRARYTQGMGFEGPIIPVYEAAYKALFRILNVSFPLFDNDSRDYRQQKDPRNMSLNDRKALAAEITAVWKQAKGQGVAEGAFIKLQDDTASPTDWFRAIDNIVQPADGTRTRYVLTPPQGEYSLARDDGFKAQGESVRAKTNPSVSDLLIKRFEQLVQRKADSDFDVSQLSKILLALASWDGKAHVADLKRLGDELDARFVRDTGSPSAEVHVSLCEKRLLLGDPTALADYVTYVRHLSSDELKKCYQQGQGVDFGILWHYPDDHGVQQAVESLFSGKNAPLVPIPNSLAATPLIGVPAFRQEVLRGLGDKSPAGTYEVRDGGFNCVFTATHASFGGGPAPNDVPKPGTEVAFRLCDNYAWDLAQIPNFPTCQLYWPEIKRDAAVAACKAMLNQYGNALRGQPSDPYDDQNFAAQPSAATLRIVPLDHPATPDEVKAGRALFSSSGTVRVWKMSSYPLGPAWQAEEILVNGKWERYFGIFRDGVPTKIPAREMEFADNFVGGAPVTKLIEAVLSGPEAIDRSQFNMEFMRRRFVPLGAPVPVNIEVCNHNGEDQAVPSEIILPPGATKMLPAGVTLMVSYSAKVPALIQRFSDPQFDFGTFEKLTLCPGIPVAPPPLEIAKLYPMQKLTVFKADLRDYFDLSRPGTYHVKAQFHVTGQPVSTTSEITFYVSSNGA